MPASRIAHKSQKLGHRTPALEAVHKIQNKIINPSPKEQTGDNHKNGEKPYFRMGYLQPHLITWFYIHDIGIQTTDHL